MLIATQIESSGYENNTERVAAAAFTRFSLLAGNFFWKMSINRNVAAHPTCLLIAGAVHRRYYSTWKYN